MRILFLHNNFPAQFGGLGQCLAREGWDVRFVTQREGVSIPGINVVTYKPHRDVEAKTHPYSVNFERAVLNGQAVARIAGELKAKGFSPDVVVAHSGWGPGLFVKDIWPQTKLVGYFEWFYRADAPDVEFLDDESRSMDNQLRARARNAAILMDLAHSDLGICPTEFQKEQFPDIFHSKLHVIHDGIDTEYYCPRPGSRLKLPDLDLTHVDELITYVARGMEPYRGFPEFMRALEIVLKERPNAHAVIVGEDRVAYGKKLRDGESYKQKALAECDLDLDRVHFTGLLPRSQYLQVLQTSSVHVYLTIPFVLSWSVLEALSTGCNVVASNVAPVQEINQKVSGAMALVDPKDTAAIANGISEALEKNAETSGFNSAGRKMIEREFSAASIYDKKMRILEALIISG
ncbi:MAG: glycosyltransferase [Pseudomonadota bacterium]